MGRRTSENLPYFLDGQKVALLPGIVYEPAGEDCSEDLEI